jgi:heat shock protein HslJ
MRVQQRDGSFVLKSVTIEVRAAATPAPQISLWADRTTINQGECTRLYWSVENVQAVWVYPQGERYSRFPRVGNDSERICPTSTTTYEMRVLLPDNTTVFRQVTITVNVVATPVPPTPTPAPVGNALENTRWDVVQFNTGSDAVTSLLADTNAQVNFGSGGQVSGNASCNNFNGSYQVNGNNITIGQASATAMLCAEPEGKMDQEAQILAALQSAATFTISGDVLELRTGGDQIAAILRRAP